MDAETLSMLFQPFHTTKVTGTGLGLGIAKKIIEAHGGRISIKSKPNKGTTVKIVLPIAP
jgi:signal transduction histidine kinase